MSNITERTVYQTSDGKSFNTREEAERWIIQKKLACAMEEEFSHHHMSDPETVAQWLFDNYDVRRKH